MFLNTQFLYSIHFIPAQKLANLHVWTSVAVFKQEIATYLYLVDQFYFSQIKMDILG